LIVKLLFSIITLGQQVEDVRTNKVSHRATVQTDRSTLLSCAPDTHASRSATW
jgi:hypothetical protein